MKTIVDPLEIVNEISRLLGISSITPSMYFGQDEAYDELKEKEQRDIFFAGYKNH